MGGEFGRFWDFEIGSLDVRFLLSGSSPDIGDRDRLREGTEGLDTICKLE